MARSHEEWLLQSDYDMDTAEYMLEGGRNFYAVFMCHLAVEKAIKGLYQFKLGKAPPKIHNFVRLLSETRIKPPEGIDMFLVSLNEAQVDTRYPHELAVLQERYTGEGAKRILGMGKEVLRWIKTML